MKNMLIALLLLIVAGCGATPELSEQAMDVFNFDEVEYEFIDEQTLRCEDMIWDAQLGEIECKWECATYEGSALPYYIALRFPVENYPLDVLDEDGNGVGDLYFTEQVIVHDKKDCASAKL